MTSVYIYKNGRKEKMFKSSNTFEKWINKTFKNSDDLRFRNPRPYITNVYKILNNNEPTGYVVEVK